MTTTRWDDLDADLRRRIARRLTARERAGTRSVARDFLPSSSCPPGPIPPSDIEARFRPLSDVVPARWYTPVAREFTEAELLAIFGPKLMPLTSERLQACVGRTVLLVRADCAVRRAAEIRRRRMWFRRLQRARGREGAKKAMKDMDMEEEEEEEGQGVHRYRDWIDVVAVGEPVDYEEEEDDDDYYDYDDEDEDESSSSTPVTRIYPIEADRESMICERDGMAHYYSMDATFRRAVDPRKLYVFFC